MKKDTVSPGYRPLSWGYAGVPRMPPVSQDAKPRLQTAEKYILSLEAENRRELPPPFRSSLSTDRRVIRKNGDITHAADSRCTLYAVNTQTRNWAPRGVDRKAEKTSA